MMIGGENGHKDDQSASSAEKQILILRATAKGRSIIIPLVAALSCSTSRPAVKKPRSSRRTWIEFLMQLSTWVTSSPALASEGGSGDGFFPDLMALGFSPCLRTQGLNGRLTALQLPISNPASQIKAFSSVMHSTRSNTLSMEGSLVLSGRLTAA